MGGHSAAGRVVGMACNLETCLVRLLDSYPEQFLVKRDIRCALRTGAFVPAGQRDLDQVDARLNFSPDGSLQLASLTEVTRKRNVRASVRNPGPSGANVRGTNLTCPGCMREPYAHPEGCADITRCRHAAS